MGNEGHLYSMDELLELEQEMERYEPVELKREDVFSYLEEHQQFCKKDDNELNNAISYYFHNPDNGSQLLFIDIPKENGQVYSDEGSCLGQQEWFDELFEFTKKMYDHNFNN